MPSLRDYYDDHTLVIHHATRYISGHMHATRIGNGEPDFRLLTRNHLEDAALKVPVDLHGRACVEQGCGERSPGRVDPVEVGCGQYHQVALESLVFTGGGHGRLRERQCGRIFVQPRARRAIPCQQREGESLVSLLHPSPPDHTRLAVPNHGLQRIRHMDLRHVPDTHGAAVRQRLPRALALPQHLHLQFLAVLAERHVVHEQRVPPDALRQRPAPCAEGRPGHLGRDHGGLPDHVPVLQRGIHRHHRFHGPFRSSQHLVQIAFKQRLSTQPQFQYHKGMVRVSGRAVHPLHQDEIAG